MQFSYSLMRIYRTKGLRATRDRTGMTMTNECASKVHTPNAPARFRFPFVQCPTPNTSTTDLG